MYVNLHPVAIHIRRNLRGLTYEWPFNYEGIRLGGLSTSTLFSKPLLAGPLIEMIRPFSHNLVYIPYNSTRSYEMSSNWGSVYLSCMLSEGVQYVTMHTAKCFSQLTHTQPSWDAECSKHIYKASSICLHHNFFFICECI